MVLALFFVLNISHKDIRIYIYIITLLTNRLKDHLVCYKKYVKGYIINHQKKKIQNYTEVMATTKGHEPKEVRHALVIRAAARYITSIALFTANPFCKSMKLKRH